MKVSELIEILKGVDPDLMVVIDGYEGGVDVPKRAEATEIYLNAHNESYYGNHEEHGGLCDYIAREEGRELSPAFIISRRTSKY